MSRALPIRRLIAVVLTLTGIASGCGNGKGPDDTPCTGLKPAFALLIVASDGPLPSDLDLLVTYGGGTEEFSLADSERTGEVVFCAPSDQDGGALKDQDADVANLEGLRCELWTDGAASVNVEGGEYLPVERDLEAEADRCGIKTVDEKIELSFGDGGASSTD